MSKQIVISVISGVILILVGLFIGKKVEKSDRKEKYFDYYFFVQNLSEITDHDVDIMFDSNSVENLHRVDIVLYNFNDHDVENLELYLEVFGRRKGNSRVLYESALGYAGNKEIVSEILNIEKSRKPNGIRRGYKLKVAKNGDYEAPTFTTSFFIDAKDISECEINIVNNGYESRAFEYSNYSESDQFPLKFIDSDLGFLSIYIPTLLLVAFVFLLFIRRDNIRSDSDRKRYESTLSELFKYTEEKRTADKKVKIKSFTKKYKEINDQYLWDHSNKLRRWLMGYKDPNKE